MQISNDPNTKTSVSSKDTKVVVVEDDASLRADLVDFLNARDIATVGVNDGEGLWAVMGECRPALLVIDIVLPGDDGLTLVQKARAAGFSGGIIILSAMSGANHMVKGYGNGADVYLTKDADLDVIEACINRTLEKTSEIAPARPAQGWRLDSIRRTLRVGENVEVKLTAKELAILTPLMSTPGRPQARAILLELDREPTFDEQRSIDAAISRLRRKVQKETGLSLPIDHVYGIGYVFSDLAEIVAPTTKD